MSSFKSKKDMLGYNNYVPHLEVSFIIKLSMCLGLLIYSIDVLVALAVSQNESLLTMHPLTLVILVVGMTMVFACYTIVSYQAKNYDRLAMYKREHHARMSCLVGERFSARHESHHDSIGPITKIKIQAYDENQEMFHISLQNCDNDSVDVDNVSLSGLLNLVDQGKPDIILSRLKEIQSK